MSETKTTSPLTVVLVHGAFADSSSWAGVIERLHAKGVQVIAAANPLRGISVDSPYVASLFDQIPGPVLAVGHSYGGAVISNAASGANNVVGLVFVAAFAPDEGERLGEVEAASKDSVLNTALVPHQYPTASGPATEFSIDPGEGPRRVRGRPVRGAGGVDWGHPTAGGGARVLGAVRSAGVEDAAILGGRGHRRPCCRHGCGPCTRRAGRRRDHGGRRLARDHDLEAPGRRRRDPVGDRQGRLR
jgi:pimeloyl-ACP methyl ester carboxylesterase